MIKTLNQRERYMVIGGGVLLGLVLVVFILILPYQNAMERFERKIITRQAQLAEVRQLQADYLQLRQQSSRLKRMMDQGGKVPPLTFLEETARTIGGRENLLLMRPLGSVDQGSLQIDTIEFKLERLTLEQVVRLLREIEQAQPPMRVDRLLVKQRFDDATQLDMTTTVSTTRSPR